MTLADDDNSAGTAEQDTAPPDDRPHSLPAVLDRRPDDPETRPSLSVVIPTLNEADHVADCLDSVLRACRPVDSTEVVLVDSNSTDETVVIAREYPITILRIDDDAYTTPGAGRYVGGLAARGEKILFVDGDTELTRGWLTDAMALVAEDRVAAVDGHLNACGATTPRPIQAPHGVMLYDATVLDKIGGFDPFLRGYEDVDLGLRAGAAGYERVRLPAVVAEHARPTGVSEVRRRWQNDYFTGIGQTARKHLRSPTTLAKLAVRKWDLMAFLGWCSLGVVSALVALPASAAWTVATALMFVVDAAWEGVSGARERWLRYVVAWLGIARGLLGGRRSPESFPLDTVTVVATAPPTHPKAPS